MKKTMMKLLSVVMALMMLFGSFSTLVSAAAPHEHDKTTKLETIGPRCNAYGYTLYICSCGETWATDIVQKTDGVHSLEVDGTFKEIKAVEPSCLAAGNTAGKACSWCGDTLEGNEEVGKPLGHDAQWVLEAGDCNNVESIVYKCVRANCNTKGVLNDPQRQPIDLVNCGAAGHNFVYKITKYPTCTAIASKAGTAYRVSVDGQMVPGYVIEHTDGTAEYECLDCGTTYKGIVVPWFNHDASNLVHKTNGSEDLCDEIIFGTKIENGKTVEFEKEVVEVFKAEWDECLVCGYATNYSKKNDVLKHNYVRATVAEAQALGYRTNFQEAFCYQSGYEVKICKNLVNGKACDDVHVVVTNVEHAKSFTCPTCADCTDCTHKDRVLKCKNYTPGFCMEKSEVTYKEHAFGEQKYYTYTYNGVEYTDKYDATVNLCRPVEVFQKCEHENCAARKVLATVVPDARTVEHLVIEYIAGSEYKEADCEEDGYIMTNCLACLAKNVKLVGEDAIEFIEERELTALAGYNFLATGHNYDVTKGKVNPAKPAINATCVAKGQTAEIWCNNRGNCEHVIQESKELPVRTDIDSYDAHDKAKLTPIGQHIPGTCTTPETDYFRCSDCGHTVYKEGTLNQFNHEYYTIDKDLFTIVGTDSKIVDVEYKKEVCGVTDGNHKYQQCKYCFNVIAVDTDDNGVLEKEKDLNKNGLYNDDEPYTDKNANEKYDSGEEYEDLDENGKYTYADRYFSLEDTIIKKDHIFGEVDALKETCYADGHNAYETTCTRCGAESPLTKKIIPAHGDNFATIINSEAYDPTCITPGVAAGRFCAECDTFVLYTATKPSFTCTDTGAKDPDGNVIYKIDTGKKDAKGNVIYKDWAYKAKPDLKKPTDADPWYIKPMGHYSNNSDYFSTRLPHMAEVDVKGPELGRVTVEKGTHRTEKFRVIYCTYCLASDTYDVINYDKVNDILLGRCEDPGKTVAPGAWLVYKITTGIDHKYPTPVFPEDAKADKTLTVNVTNNFDSDFDGVLNAGFDECTTDKEWYVACEFGCGTKQTVKVEAAEGHYYIKDGKKTVIDISCTKIDEFKDWHCSHCDKIVGRTIVAKHNIVEVIEPAKCEYTTTDATKMKLDEGRRFFACADCDARYFKDASDPFATPVDHHTTTDDTHNHAECALPHVEVLKPTGHDFLAFKTDKDGKLAGFKAPTMTETGYVTRVCAKCGDVVSKLPKLVPQLNVDVVAVRDNLKKTMTVASGDEFKVHINYSGDFYQFNALQVNLGFDSTLAKFVKENLDATLPAGVAVKEEKDGKLVVAIYTLDGQTLKEGETKTVELTFRSRKNHATEQFIWIDSAATFDAKGAEIDSSASTGVYRINLGAPESLIANVTGELNNYPSINAGDAIVMMDLIYAEEYRSTADLNKDKVVDYKDFALLSKLIATDGSDKAYNECISANVTAKSGVYYTRVS